MLSRSFLPDSEKGKMLAYTPMFHARLFAETQKYRDTHYQATREPLTEVVPDPAPAPWLDGNPAIDRPLFVQFCANDPKYLLAAAKIVAPYCDAVDLNLGCPQGIAKKGHYGSFLQEDQDLIYRLINTLHENLDVPVTAKIRILETKEATLAYAQNVLRAGASILTVHGRRREQKGHITGLADWQMIRYLRDNLPPETVLFANGNILQHGDLERCLAATGADAVMSAEGNLSDPAIFATPPPPGQEGREYWRPADGRGGWRVDAVFRRYLDILHRYVFDAEPPARRPLFMPGDDVSWLEEEPKPTTTEQQQQQPPPQAQAQQEEDGPPRKKQKPNGNSSSKSSQQQTQNNNNKKKDDSISRSPNMVGLQGHLFHMLRHFVTRHTDVRDMLAKARLGDISTFEAILEQVERKVARGLLDYQRTNGQSILDEWARDEEEARKKRERQEEAARKIREAKQQNGAAAAATTTTKPAAAEQKRIEEAAEEEDDDPESSVRAVKECKRPWWVIQPIVRPLPKEALAKGAIQLKGKEGKQSQKTPRSERGEKYKERVRQATDYVVHKVIDPKETVLKLKDGSAAKEKIEAERLQKQQNGEEQGV